MSHQHEHIESARNYILVFLGLIFLTVLTTAVAFVDLGAFNIVVALGIATCKMLLVALWFMHVKDSSALTKLVITGALLWLATRWLPALASGAHGLVQAVLLLAVIAAGIATYGLFLRLFGVAGWREAVNASRQSKR